MNFSNYRITLDIQKSKTQASIPVHYKDTGNRLYITLTDGGNPYIIPDGCQAVFVANRPNPETNPPLINDCIIENNSVVRYDFNNKTASVEGMHKCEIRIIGPNHELITTPSFVMVVDQRVVYDDVIADDDEIAAISALKIITSEEERVKAENIRKQNETDRFEAEGARVAAENARVKAENARTSTISRLGKQVSNLVSQISDELIVTDAKVAYTKEVPARSAPYAEITKFGGMSYNDNGTLCHAKPTAFKCLGKNMFNPQWLLDVEGVTKTDDGFYKCTASALYNKYGKGDLRLPIKFKSGTYYSIRFEGYNQSIDSYQGTFMFETHYTNGSTFTGERMEGTYNREYYYIEYGNIESIGITFHHDDVIYIKNIFIGEGYYYDEADGYEYPLDYSPYVEHVLPIPKAVQAISEYGYGINNGGYNYAYNYVDWTTREFHKVIKKGIISNVFKPETTYTNIQYFAFPKPADFSGYQSTSSYFIIDGFDTRTGSGNWDNSGHIGTVTGSASYTDMWVGFPAGTTLEEAKAALEGKEWIYVLKNEEVTDIPDLPDDNLIPVEGGVTITAVNDYDYDVPSKIIYQLRRAT